MSQVISISNQKGGVGKSVTTANLAAALVKEGRKALVIDLDPQSNLTLSLGVQSPDNLPYTIADVLEKAIHEEPIDPLEGVIRHPESIDLMPANIQLSGYDTRLMNEVGRENMLRQYIDAARPFYDHIRLRKNPSTFPSNYGIIIQTKGGRSHALQNRPGQKPVDILACMSGRLRA